MYLCMYIYIYIYTYVHVYTHSICTCIHTYMYTSSTLHAASAHSSHARLAARWRSDPVSPAAAPGQHHLEAHNDTNYHYYYYYY